MISFTLPGGGLASIFTGPPKPKAPPPPPPPPPVDTSARDKATADEADRKKREQDAANRRRAGRGQTIFTSGTLGVDEQNLTRKSLLGS